MSVKGYLSPAELKNLLEEAMEELKGKPYPPPDLRNPAHYKLIEKIERAIE